MRHTFIYLFVVFLLTMTACQKLWFCEDEEFYINKSNYFGSMRIDGYYFHLNEKQEYDIILFYENGVTLHDNFLSCCNTLNEIENKISGGNYHSNIKENHRYWGLFIIDDGNVKIEKLDTRNCKRPIRRFNGAQITDTSFVLTSVEIPRDEEFGSIEKIYYFKEFSPKPDSTNDFTN